MYSHSPNHSTTSLSDIDEDDIDINKSAFFPGLDQALVVSPGKWSSKFRSLSSRIHPLGHSPMSHLPPEVLIHILKHLNSSRDLYNALLVNRTWCECSVELLWHKPSFSKLSTLVKMMRVLSRADQTFNYAHFIRRLNFLFLGQDITDSLFCRLAQCDRLERLTLVGCTAISDEALTRVLPCCPNLVAVDLTGVVDTNDQVINSLAESANRLQGINLGGCKKVTDNGIMTLARNCPLLRRVKLSGVELVTDEPISALAKSCPLLLEIDLNNCKQITDLSVRDIWTYSTHMRELRLAHCVLTDAAFPAPPKPEKPGGQHPNPFASSTSRSTEPLPPLVISRTFEHLRMLDLTACAFLTDDAIEGVISHAPKIRNLVLSKCVQLTDRTVENICKLGRYIHYLHLGHAASITDRSVRTLARCCTRIRYIDFANCVHLTDMSVFELSSLPKLRRIGLVRVSNLTDEAIYSLAHRHATLERIHLSYCDQITVIAIHFLLQKLHKLTHLSLTGIPAFRKPELQKFCRPPPSDFNMSQRATFCVYSGKGVTNLRAFLTELFDQITEDMNTADDTEYDEDDDNHRAEVHDPDVETGEDDDEYLSRRVYFGANVRGYRLPRPPRGPSRQPPIRRDHQERTVIIPQQPNGATLEPPTIVETDGDSDRMDVVTTPVASPRRFRGFGQSAVVETSASPPPSDAASVRSTGTNQSNGAFFRTHQEIASSSHSNGALTPDLNYAEIGHGRGTERTPQAGPSSLPHTPLKRVAEPMSHLDTLAGQSPFDIPRTIDGPEPQPEMLDDQAYGFGGPVFFPPYSVEPEETPVPTPMNVDHEEAAQSNPAAFPPEAGRVAKRGLRNPFAFASSPFSFSRLSNGHDPGKSNGYGMDPGPRKH